MTEPTYPQLADLIDAASEEEPDPRELILAVKGYIGALNDQMASRENLQAMIHLQQAVGWLDARKDARTEQGVRGTPERHQGPHEFVCTVCGQVATIHLH